MIQTFKHKGLERFFWQGDRSGIQPHHATKLRLQLSALDSASEISDMGAPNWDLHPLLGDLQFTWSVSVNGNWRLVFKFQNGHAYMVNYMDYH